MTSWRQPQIPAQYYANQRYGIFTTNVDGTLASEDHAETLIKELIRSDEEKISNCNSDIDALLIFAGLFSAVIAAFIIESYKTLQEDPVDRSMQLLTQLVALSSNTNSTTIVQPIPDFVVPSSAVVINALWFAALVCSLTATSLGIFVKQWLREYIQFRCTAPEERIRIRYIRNENLRRWRVFGIAASLPFILQLALLLFFIGLSEFLRPLNDVVWAVTTTLVAIWLACYLFIILTPIISSSCPYKTSLLGGISSDLRVSLNRIWYRRRWRSQAGFYRFPGDEQAIRRDYKLDTPALIQADQTLIDDVVLLDTLEKSIMRTPSKDMIIICRQLLSHRLDRDINDLRDIHSDEYSMAQARGLRAVVDILSKAMQMMIKPSPKPNNDINNYRNEALTALCAIYRNVISNKRGVDPADAILPMLRSLVHEQNEENLQMFVTSVWIPKNLNKPGSILAHCIGNMSEEDTSAVLQKILKTTALILNNTTLGSSPNPEPIQIAYFIISAMESVVPQFRLARASNEAIYYFTLFMRSLQTYTDKLRAQHIPLRSREHNALANAIAMTLQHLERYLHGYRGPNLRNYFSGTFGIVFTEPAPSTLGKTSTANPPTPVAIRSRRN